MKKIVLLMFLMICITTLFAQESAMITYVLQFTDKGNLKAASLNPANYFTDKAIDRRLKQKISFDQADIPINDQYTQAISKTGANILSRSRWFNTILIEANSSMINEIYALPYISKIESPPITQFFQLAENSIFWGTDKWYGNFATKKA